MIQVDVRGFSCPEPLIRTRTAVNELAEGETLEILVDTVTSRENVRRFLMTKNFEIEIEDLDDGFKVVARK
ncbi:MAG: sulfurtransferase TusA family protein [Brevefilum sp.]|jgi:tRNA 2-thiouridine synthesizing protein A